MDAAAQRVSMIIPNYNKAKTLGACLAAAYAQTSPPAEVIVVDDASTDSSPDIARGFPCTLIELPGNRGVSVARNAGAAASRGDILFFVDSDLALAPDAVENVLRVLRDDPECAMVQGIYDKEPLFADGPVETYKTLFEHVWRRGNAGLVSVPLFALGALRRSVFDEVGGFDERFRDAQDIEFGTRLPAGSRIRQSAAVVGRHDDVDSLWPFVREQFRRAQGFALAVGKGWHRVRAKGVSSTRIHKLSALGLLSCALVIAVTPLLFWSPWFALAQVGGLAVFVAANRGLLGFVRREKGLGYALFCTGMHFLLYAAAGTGTAVGVLRAISRRGRWRDAPRPVSGARGASG